MCYQVNAKGVHLGIYVRTYTAPLRPFFFSICTVLLPFRLCIYNSVAGFFFFFFFFVTGRIGRELESARGSLVVVPCPVVVLLYEDKIIFVFVFFFLSSNLLFLPFYPLFFFNSRTKVSSSLCRSLPKMEISNRWRYKFFFFQFSSSSLRWWYENNEKISLFLRRLFIYF